MLGDAPAVQAVAVAEGAIPALEACVQSHSNSQEAALFERVLSLLRCAQQAQQQRQQQQHHHDTAGAAAAGSHGGSQSTALSTSLAAPDSLVAATAPARRHLTPLSLPLHQPPLSVPAAAPHTCAAIAETLHPRECASRGVQPASRWAGVLSSIAIVLHD